MDIVEMLDDAITELWSSGFDEAEISNMLCDPDFRVVDEIGEDVPLLEVVRRQVVRRGGHRITKTRRGRPNPARSIKAKQAARRGAAKRRLAARNPGSKRKRAQAMRMRKSMGLSRPRLRPRVRRR